MGCVGMALYRYALIFFLIIFLSSGCSMENGKVMETPLASPKPLGAEKAAASQSPVEFYPSPDQPDMSDLEALRHWSNLLSNNMYSFVSPLVIYYQVNGEWPADWDALLNGYVLFLPANPDTLKPYALLELDNLQGAVEAGTIVAEIDKDGWDLYSAVIKPDGSFDSLINKRDTVIEFVEKHGMTPDLPRMQTVNKLLGSWEFVAIDTFINRHNRLPESYSELTEGYIRNTSTALGYTPAENGAGSFRIGVNPDTYSWASGFTPENGYENINIHKYEENEYGRLVLSSGISFGSEDFKGFTWILSQEDFMD